MNFVYTSTSEYITEFGLLFKNELCINVKKKI